MEGVPECTACGACCTGEAQAYVAVTGDDWSRLGDDAEALASFDGRLAFMKMKDGHCASLRVGRVVGGRFLCAIYATRPEVCRALVRGSPSCTAEIDRKGDGARRLPRAR